NLNCIGCSHFSTLAPEQFIDIEKYEDDCKRIAVLSGGDIRHINLLGGEPLLNPHLTDIIKISRSYFPECTIRIVTNGLLLKNQPDEFWECCRINNVIIAISVYPVNIDYNFIFSKMEKHNVQIAFATDSKFLSKGDKELPFDHHDIKWRKVPIDIGGGQNPSKSNALCTMTPCYQLVEGKICKCPRVAYVKFFNSYFNVNLKVTEDDYIDIYEAKTIDEIQNKLRKPVPFCRYCNMDGQPQYIKWKTTKKEISEWADS
ncbi:MAG: radical SAM protein, partial [Treponema sp.]|nr:radical SAM protein [Treponema sp.]